VGRIARGQRFDRNPATLGRVGEKKESPSGRKVKEKTMKGPAAVDAIVKQQAADIARQAEDETDPDFLPWGGNFSTKEEVQRRGVKFAVAKPGEC
jgi:hypothetical protein